MACWLYEGMLLFGVAFASALVFSIAGQMRSGMDERRPLLMAFVFIVFGIYFAWCWSRGQTLAMRTWRIRVTGRDGAPIGQWRALFRYLCCWLWVLPPMAFVAPLKLSAAEIGFALVAWVVLWALLSQLRADRQFWHDVIAGTRLVSAEPVAPNAS